MTSRRHLLPTEEGRRGVNRADLPANPLQMAALVDRFPTMVGRCAAALPIESKCAHTGTEERKRHEIQRAAHGPAQEAGPLPGRARLRAGVSRQTVSKWESGQSYPDFQRLVLLADYFDISLDELVRGLDVGDVRALNESEKQLSSIYADVEGGKAAMRKYIRVLLGIGAAILAFFAGIVLLRRAVRVEAAFSYAIISAKVKTRPSQSPDDHRGHRGDDRTHRSLEAPPQQAARESSGLDVRRIANLNVARSCA